MNRSPLFPNIDKHGIPADFLRNYWCPHYNICLEEAAVRNLYLDCSDCYHKEERAFDLCLGKNLP